MNSKLLVRLLTELAILVILLTAYGGSASVQEEIIGKWEIRDESSGDAVKFGFKEM